MSGASRGDLLRNVAALDATVTIARTLAGQTDLETILDLIARRARALVSARALAIELQEEGGRTVVATVAGELPEGLIGESGLGRVGLDAGASLVVPLKLRGRSYGVLVAVDCQRGPKFTLEDEELLEAFAASAATAVATAQTFDVTHRRNRLAAAEAERARWARELHNETLQGLRGLRTSLAAMEGADPATAQELIQQAIADVEAEVERLCSLITDLRPMVFDHLGTGAAIEALADRIEVPDLEIRTLIDLSFEEGRVETRHDDELETAIYRIVEEALSNTVKHAGASCIVVEVIEDDERAEVRLSVRDDGKGFDPTAESDGFGLSGMRERVEVLGGSIEISSAVGEGAEVRVVIPSGRDSAAAEPV